VDITARKEAEGAREALLDALAAQPLFGVVLFHGPRLVFERANQTYRQMVGGRDVVGRPLLEALPELVGQGFDTLLQEVRRTGVPTIRRETPAQVDRSGTGVLEDGYFDVVFQPVCSPGGACEDVLHVVHDVTDRVKLRQEADRLMALEKERASFEKQLIGIVSHDLRNPISAIQMGATTLLRRPDIEERQRRTVERILTSAGRAKRLIHDLLDFTQARLRGGLDAVTTQGDFHAVVRQVLEETQVANPQRPLHLTQTGEGAGTFDADRVEQLVGNLLSNALHYSPADSPVHVETRGEADALVLTVHNGGGTHPARADAPPLPAHAARGGRGRRVRGAQRGPGPLHRGPGGACARRQRAGGVHGRRGHHVHRAPASGLTLRGPGPWHRRLGPGPQRG
jgi:signal transduction histidine kinase